MEQPIKKNQIFLLCQISPSASSTRDLGTRLTKTIRPFALKVRGSIADLVSPHGLLTCNPQGYGSNGKIIPLLAVVQS